jgi:hypothetical protein
VKRLTLSAALLTAVAAPAVADQPAGEPGSGSADGREIVVTAERIITSALRDVPVERRYDPDHIASYAVSTVGDVLDEITRENGDEEPALLVNGEPVSGREDIEDYPAEAIARIEVLPRGAAGRIGGAPGQRAYNVVLRDRVTTATATASHRLATDGGWNAELGELLLTHIRKQDRANLTLRARDSGLLLESDRDVVQPAQFVPFDPIGNVLPFPFGAAEVDPALSALAGTLVTAAGVPAGVRSPTLTDFSRTANRLNSADLGQFRSLRSANRGYEAAFAGSMRLLPWLTASATGKLEWSKDRGLGGLPGTQFVLPETNPASPFSRDVLIALSDETRPLRSRGSFDTANATFMLSGRLGEWNPRLTARLLRQERTYSFERSGQSFASPIVLGPAQNPFAQDLAPLITVTRDLTRTRTESEGLRADIDGPLLKLPAGRLLFRAGAGVNWNRLSASRSSGVTTAYSRSDTTLEAGLTVPIASAREGALPALGELEATADVARVDLSRQAALWHWSSALNWQFRPWLRLNGGIDRTRNPPEIELLSAPVVSYPNVRLFDPVREETVDVTSISGGNPALRAETVDVVHLSVGAAPDQKYNLQQQPDFTATDSRNGLGSLPPTSTAVMAAFPGRYQRDASGRLVVVDSRPINFARQQQDQLRYGASFTIPLYRNATPLDGAGPVTATAGPKPRLDLTFGHTVLFSNRILIARGLPEIDLLREGASGLGGSRPRHLIDGSIALTDRGTGLRLNGSWRSTSSILAGTAFDPQRIRFGSLAIFDLRAFAETARLFPGRDWAKGGRVTLSVRNLANTRQDVRDSRGNTPLSYQPAYRDAVGRTFEIELRKAF